MNLPKNFCKRPNNKQNQGTYIENKNKIFKILHQLSTKTYRQPRRVA